MRAADPLGASRARSAEAGDHLALGKVVTSVEYDVVGEREGRWAQVRTAIKTIEDVRRELESLSGVNTTITWHVIARTTTTVEALADHRLTPPATESDHQLHLDLSPPS